MSLRHLSVKNLVSRVAVRRRASGIVRSWARSRWQLSPPRRPYRRRRRCLRGAMSAPIGAPPAIGRPRVRPAAARPLRQFASPSYSFQPTLVSASQTAGGIWDTGAGAVTIGASSNFALTLSGTTVNGHTTTGVEVDAGAGALTINCPVTLSATQLWINNSTNPLTVNSTVNCGGQRDHAQHDGNGVAAAGRQHRKHVQQPQQHFRQCDRQRHGLRRQGFVPGRRRRHSPAQPLR